MNIWVITDVSREPAHRNVDVGAGTVGGYRAGRNHYTATATSGMSGGVSLGPLWPAAPLALMTDLGRSKRDRQSAMAAFTKWMQQGLICQSLHSY